MDVNQSVRELGFELFYAGGTYDRALELIEAIAEWISKGGFEPEPDSGSGFGFEAFMIGAYHYCIDHHAGQDSDEYRIQCLIGEFYTPSFSGKLEPESHESLVYLDLCLLSQER